MLDNSEIDPHGFRTRRCGNHFGLWGTYLEPIPGAPEELGSPAQTACRNLRRCQKLLIKSWI